MKIVQINSTCGSGSTGKICVAVSELLTARNIENYILYAVGSSDYPPGIRYMDPFEVKQQALWSRVFGYYGFQSKAATRRLIGKLDEISPDIVHLHNLHSHNAHLGILLSYLKQKGIKVFWTFHDCWPFTGYCTHYGVSGCENWKSGCKDCPVKKHYSWFFDRSSYLYARKKELLSDLDLTIVTPSHWMARQVAQSFLGNTFPVKVIHNGIDLSVFHPENSNFREKYGIKSKYIVLGVAFDWGQRKGLDVFVELAKRLDDRFQIVLVGTTDNIDRDLPKNILSIHRTQDQRELAEIYTAADVFVNPTREEVFGLVNVEANACGTPVITFDTGGSPECIDKESGIIIAKNDIAGLEQAIGRTCNDRPFSSEKCIARAEQFSQQIKYAQYLSLYRR